MIIGGSKTKVIENIKTNILNNELNKKVEIGDPNLTEEEVDELLNSFYKNKKNKTIYNFKKNLANSIVKKIGKEIYPNIEIDGLENLNSLDLSKGAIITSNHFNPLDSYNIRKLANLLKKELYIVIQDTNLALPNELGLLMNYMNTIPLKNSPNYILDTFKNELEKVLNKGNLVLIYPEEEMWFNYRKPRPCKRGAYQFASMLDVPIISCFVEMIDLDEDDYEEFYKVKYKVHILKPLIPDKNKSDRANSIELSKKDYEQKKESYELSYDTKLDYEFSSSDIAGLKKD